MTGPADTAGPGFAYPLPLTADGVTAAWFGMAMLDHDTYAALGV